GRYDAEDVGLLPGWIGRADRAARDRELLAERGDREQLLLEVIGAADVVAVVWIPVGRVHDVLRAAKADAALARCEHDDRLVGVDLAAGEIAVLLGHRARERVRRRLIGLEIDDGVARQL